MPAEIQVPEQETAPEALPMIDGDDSPVAADLPEGLSAPDSLPDADGISVVEEVLEEIVFDE